MNELINGVLWPVDNLGHNGRTYVLDHASAFRCTMNGMDVVLRPVDIKGHIGREKF